jgi:hypothetical protein
VSGAGSNYSVYCDRGENFSIYVSLQLISRLTKLEEKLEVISNESKEEVGKFDENF